MITYTNLIFMKIPLPREQASLVFSCLINNYYKTIIFKFWFR